MTPKAPCIYVCDPKKYIYIKNPKAACSSILQVIYDWGHGPVRRLPLHGRGNGGRSKRIKADFKPDYFKFSFVRNPWSRFVSLFQDKTKNVIGTNWQMRNWSRYKNHTFEEFAQAMLKRDVNNIDRHSRLQYLNLNRAEYIDFYGKVENFEEDMNYVASKIGLEIQNIPWQNKAVKTDYREYYNNETIKIVEEIYQKDIEVFGYTFDGQK